MVGWGRALLIFCLTIWWEKAKKTLESGWVEEWLTSYLLVFFGQPTLESAVNL